MEKFSSYWVSMMVMVRNLVVESPEANISSNNAWHLDFQRNDRLGGWSSFRRPASQKAHQSFRDHPNPFLRVFGIIRTPFSVNDISPVQLDWLIKGRVVVACLWFMIGQVHLHRWPCHERFQTIILLFCSVKNSLIRTRLLIKHEFLGIHMGSLRPFFLLVGLRDSVKCNIYVGKSLVKIPKYRLIIAFWDKKIQFEIVQGDLIKPLVFSL
jgi:hypothetical protein